MPTARLDEIAEPVPATAGGKASLQDISENLGPAKKPSPAAPQSPGIVGKIRDALRGPGWQPPAPAPEASFGGTVWNDISSIPGGAYNLVTHPIDTLRAITHPPNQEMSVPELLGHVATMGLLSGVPPLARNAPGLSRAGVAGIRAAAPDVAAGAIKIGAGEAAGYIPGMEWPGRIALGYPGIRQVARGVTKGVNAAKAAFNPEEALATGAPAASAGPAGAPSLDEIALGQYGKAFEKLTVEQQALIRNLQQRISPTPNPPLGGMPPPPTAPRSTAAPSPAGMPPPPAGSIDPTELHRQFFANANQMDLGPESPAGTPFGKGIRQAWLRRTYGKEHWADLTHEQKYQANEFLLRNGRLPEKSDIGR